MNGGLLFLILIEVFLFGFLAGLVCGRSIYQFADRVTERLEEELNP